MDPRPYTYQYRKPRLSNPTFQSGHLYQSIYHIGSYGKMFPNMDKISNNQTSSKNNINYKINTQKQRQAQQMINQRIRQIDPYIQNIKNNQKQYQYNNGSKYGERQQNNNDYQRRSNGSYKNKQRQRQSPNFMAKQQRNMNIQRQLIEPRQSYQLKRSQQQFQQFKQNKSQRIPHQQRQALIDRRGSLPVPVRSQSQQTPSLSSRQNNDQTAYMSNYGSRLMKPMIPGVNGRGQDFIYERQQKPYNIISCYPKQVSGLHRVYPKLTLENKLIQTGKYPFYSNNPQRY